MSTVDDLLQHPLHFQQPSVSGSVDGVEDETLMQEEDAEMPYSCSVTFAVSEHVLEIPSRDTYTEAEIRAAHYSREDYKEMKRDASATIQLHLSGKLTGSDDCMRGLECRTNAGFSFVKNNRQQASFAVIDEQDRQDEIGISESDLISEAYQKSSLSCRCHALAQGLFDAQEVIKDILSSYPQGTQAPVDCINDADAASLIAQCQPLDPNLLLRALSNTADDSAVSSGCHVYLDNEMDTPELESMEWTAEAA